MRRAPAGFTILEAMVALSLGFTILAGAWALVHTMSTQQEVTRDQSDLMTRAFQVEGALREELERAGQGVLSTSNWSGIHVGVSDGPSGARDTLLTMYGEGVPYRNSAYACPSGGTCILLAGQVPSLAPGDLVVTGARVLGARLFEVVEVKAPFENACGVDCFLEALACTDVPGSAIVDSRLTGSTTYHPDGTTTSSSQPCAQGYFPDGTRCEEHYENVATPKSVYNQSCAPTSSPYGWYTEVVVQERTAEFGFPQVASASTRSGASGLPLVRTQEIGFSRLWIDDSRPAPALVRQTEWTAGAGFGAALPVAANTTSLRVEVMHQGTATFSRGLQLTADSLALSASNPNYMHNETASADSLLPGYAFARSYETVAAVRVETTVHSVAEGTGEARSMSFATTVATPQIAGAAPLAAY